MTPFALIHSNVWGPLPVTNMSGIRWFVIFVDDCTRMTWLYLMKQKDEVLNIFETFHAMVCTQYGATIKVLRSDNGGEYVNKHLKTYFNHHGLIHETSCPQTPQQNGVAERKNRHILETARALLLGAYMPQRFWTDAVSTAVHLLNRMPSKVLSFQTPLQSLSTHVPLPNVLMLPPRVFGCVAYVYLHKNQRSKLDPCARRCLFLGYGIHQKGYRCYDPTARRLYVTMDVQFLEADMFYSPSASTSPLQGETHNKDEEVNWFQQEKLNEFNWISQENLPHNVELLQERPNDDLNVVHCDNDIHSNRQIDTHPSMEHILSETEPAPPLSEVPAESSPENTPKVSTPTTPLHINNIDGSMGYILPHRYNRGKPPNRYSPEIEDRRSRYPIANYVSTKGLSKPLQKFTQDLSMCRIPTSVNEALTDLKWTQAINEEMEALLKNNTWTLVPLPEGKRTVGCRWVFSVKHKADGSVDRYKARLVAKGYTQTYGVDYQETFSPVAKLNTVRVLLSLAANLDWPLHQLDVKNAFLHGELKEEVYMEVPPGYTTLSKTEMVCKLQRALYGLKQSPRAWFGRFSLAMKKYGFQQSNSDHTLFLKHKLGKVTALIVYVDDIIITGDDVEEMSQLQKQLATEFEMKNLGGLKYFLGIEVAR